MSTIYTEPPTLLRNWVIDQTQEAEINKQLSVRFYLIKNGKRTLSMKDSIILFNLLSEPAYISGILTNRPKFSKIVAIKTNEVLQQLGKRTKCTKASAKQATLNSIHGIKTFIKCAVHALIPAFIDPNFIWEYAQHMALVDSLVIKYTLGTIFSSTGKRFSARLCK